MAQMVIIASLRLDNTGERILQDIVNSLLPLGF